MATFVLDLPTRATGMLLLVLAGALAAAGCSGHVQQADKSKASAPAELPVLAAEVLEIQPVSWPQTVRSQGSLVADDMVVVGAKIAGRVEQVNVDLGDSTAANATIATLDQEEFKLQVALAEAQLVQARAALGLAGDDPVAQLNPQKAPPVREAQAVLDEARLRTERAQSLRARNAVTQEELDTALAAELVAEARYTAANNGVLEKIALIHVRSAELELAKQRLVDAVILAPFEGLIHQRHVSQGSYVQIGDPIVTLVRTSTLRFQGTLPERHAVRLAVGQQVRLMVESVAEPREATITRISPLIAEQSRSLMFEAKLDNSDGRLQAGLFAEAEVIVDPDSHVMAIPPAAIIEFAGAEKVWKVVDGVAQEQLVETARRGETAVEIVSGLSAGDVILHNAAEGKVAKIEPITGTSVARPVSLVEDAAESPPETEEPQTEEATSGAAAE